MFGSQTEGQIEAGEAELCRARKLQVIDRCGEVMGRCANQGLSCLIDTWLLDRSASAEANPVVFAGEENGQSCVQWILYIDPYLKSEACCRCIDIGFTRDLAYIQGDIIEIAVVGIGGEIYSGSEANLQVGGIASGIGRQHIARQRGVAAR